MKFEVKKAQNCFANAENYEYRISMPGRLLLELLSANLDAKTRINDKLRRPTFFAELSGGERLKGLMDKNIIKVGYIPDLARGQKERFESWLMTL